MKGILYGCCNVAVVSLIENSGVGSHIVYKVQLRVVHSLRDSHTVKTLDAVQGCTMLQLEVILRDDPTGRVIRSYRKACSMKAHTDRGKLVDVGDSREILILETSVSFEGQVSLINETDEVA